MKSDNSTFAGSELQKILQNRNGAEVRLVNALDPTKNLPLHRAAVLLELIDLNKATIALLEKIDRQTLAVS